MRYPASDYRKHIMVLLAVLIIQTPSPGLALDAPHASSPGYEINCENCHWTHGSTVPPWLNLPNLPDAADNTLSNRKCYACHDGSNALIKAVTTHSSYRTASLYWTTQGGWTTQCVTCHDPHQQRQTRVWGTATHLTTGAVSAVGSWDTGANTTQITAMSTIAENYNGYYLIPDRSYNYYYDIVSDTAGTDTFQVKGQVEPAYVNGGGYAVVYGKNVSESIRYKNPGGITVGGPVKLFRQSGDNGPGDSTNLTTSVCYVCHRSTIHWSTVGDTHYDRSNCEACHDHASGFKATCNGCHGNPPVVDTFGKPNGLVDTPARTGSSSAGAHSKHATSAGMNYQCDKCHYGGMPISPVYADNKIQIGFNIFGTGGGIYDGQALNSPFSYEGTNGTAITTDGAMTCANIYCHSNGTSVSSGTIPDNTSPAWGNGPVSCNSCHGAPPDYVNGTAKANSHPSHLAFTCDRCHSATTTDGVSISDKTTHVNGEYNLDPGAGISFSYSFAASGGTCTTISCHGSGDAVWGATLLCNACHDCPPNTTSHL